MRNAHSFVNKYTHRDTVKYVRTHVVNETSKWEGNGYGYGYGHYYDDNDDTQNKKKKTHTHLKQTRNNSPNGFRFV